MGANEPKKAAVGRSKRPWPLRRERREAKRVGGAGLASRRRSASAATSVRSPEGTGCRLRETEKEKKTEKTERTREKEETGEFRLPGKLLRPPIFPSLLISIQPAGHGKTSPP